MIVFQKKEPVDWLSRLFVEMESVTTEDGGLRRSLV